MTKLPMPDFESLRARHPDVFDRPVSARLATPVMLLGAFGVFVFGLVDLDFSPSRFLSGLHQLGGSR
jgi:phosphonate transport system permease protein